MFNILTLYVTLFPHQDFLLDDNVIVLYYIQNLTFLRNLYVSTYYATLTPHQDPLSDGNAIVLQKHKLSTLDKDDSDDEATPTDTVLTLCLFLLEKSRDFGEMGIRRRGI